jgi:uncharacterized protein
MLSVTKFIVLSASLLAIAKGQTDSTTPPTEEQIEAILAGSAASFRANTTIPLFHDLSEVGLVPENVSFPTEDGVLLKGWFIPREGSNKILIANHPRWFNRAGVNERSPDRAILRDNWWEINFIPDYKILHDEGYNILAYDTRNHGESGVTGLFTSGIYESRDVVASIRYIRSRPDTRDMTLGLFSRCNGASSTLQAVSRQPEVFEGIRAMLLIQPLSARPFLTRILEMNNVPLSHLGDLEQRVYDITGFRFDELTAVPSAGHVQTPSLLVQVHDDAHTFPYDVQSMYDNIPIDDKQLYWINGTDKRWDGYSWFQREPQLVIDWFAERMK